MRYLLVYDDGCGPCTRFRDAVDLLDAARRLDYAGLEEADRSGRLDPVPPSRRHRSFHLVSPRGQVWSGASALPPLAALLPGGRATSSALRVPPVFSAAAFVYATFSRLHDSGSCAYAQGCAAREPAVSTSISTSTGPLTPSGTLFDRMAR